MGLLCRNCGKDAIDEEDNACHNCGVVTEGIEISSHHNPFSTEIHATLQPYQTKKTTQGLDLGLHMLNTLCGKFSVAGDIKEKAAGLLKKIYGTRHFGRSNDIGVLAGCCLVHYMKLSKIYVSLMDLCRKLSCTKKLAFKYSNIVKEYLNERNKDEDVKPEDLPQSEMTFDESVHFSVRNVLGNISTQDKDTLIAKTVALCKLAEELWILSGRSTEAVICASAYLCYSSMNPSRNYYSFKEFCSEYSFNYQKGSKRVAEIREMLLKLGQKIPSLTQNYVTKKNVLYHLDYILENSESLRNDLLSDVDEDTETKEFACFRKEPLKRKQVEEADPVPIKYIKTERGESSDFYISDTEISSYIRDKKQVKVILDLQKNSK